MNFSFMNKLMLKIVRHIPIPLILLLMLIVMSMPSCGNEQDPGKDDIVQTDTLPDPVQYNTPFAAVPDPRDAVIYQVNMRVFSNTRNFQGVTQKLDSIKALGVNVIYLMPVYPLGQLKAFNSPYCIKDYRSVNAEFGSLETLRVLIDGAHERGMAVILDWVANHTSWDHPWVKDHPDWYVYNTSGGMVNPNGWSDVVQLNFSKQDMCKMMIKDMKYWILTANCDGFRCDYADGPPYAFWKQALDTLRNMKTHKLLMLAEGTKSSLFGAGFDYIFGFNFFGQLKNAFAGQSAVGFSNLNSSEYYLAGEMNRVVRYTTNHDVNGSDGTPFELYGGTKGSVSAFVLAAFMKAVPMIYNGQEVGTDFRITFPFTGKVIDWTTHPEMKAEYKKLMSIRASNPVFSRADLSMYSSADVCAFSRSEGASKVFVMVNVHNKSVNFSVPAVLQGTSWTNTMTGKTLDLSATIGLDPYEYLILKN